MKRACVDSFATGVPEQFALLREALDRAWEEIKIVPPSRENEEGNNHGTNLDGIQVDSSFHQHSAQLYMGSYGLAFTNSMLKYMQQTSGTSLFVSSSRSDLIVDLLVDGYQWMSVGRHLQWSAMGRDLGTARWAVFDNYITTMPSKRTFELGKYYRLFTNRSAFNEEPLLGHRAFWTSDYVVQRSVSPFSNKLWVASLHMNSRRTVGAECVNDQGALHEHKADGVIYMYYEHWDAGEYAAIWKEWNWTKLPGTTLEQTPVQSCQWSEQKQLDSQEMDLVGSSSDGTIGISGMQFVSHNLRAKKAVGFLQHAIVGLVADISCSSGNEVVTTVESTLARGQVHAFSSLMTQPETVHEGKLSSYPSLIWVHHANTGYLLLGNPAQINHRGDVNQTVFTLEISHGTNDTGLKRSAAYITIPGVDVAHMEALAGQTASLAVVENSAEVQAVWHVGADRVVVVGPLAWRSIAACPAGAFPQKCTVLGDHPYHSSKIIPVDGGCQFSAAGSASDSHHFRQAQAVCGTQSTRTAWSTTLTGVAEHAVECPVGMVVIECYVAGGGLAGNYKAGFPGATPIKCQRQINTGQLGALCGPLRQDPQAPYAVSGDLAWRSIAKCPDGWYPLKCTVDEDPWGPSKIAPEFDGGAQGCKFSAAGPASEIQNYRRAIAWCSRDVTHAMVDEIRTGSQHHVVDCPLGSLLLDCYVQGGGAAGGYKEGFPGSSYNRCERTVDTGNLVALCRTSPPPVTEQLLAVFWKEGSVSFPPMVSVNRAATLLITPLTDPTVIGYRITVNDPRHDQAGSNVEVTINVPNLCQAACQMPSSSCTCQCDGANTVARVSLPGGFEAGRSVSVECFRVPAPYRQLD